MPFFSPPAQADSAPRADAKRLGQHVRFLAALQPERSHLHTKSLGAASDYIEARFREYGFNPVLQKYDVNGRTYQNVTVVRGPKNTRRLVVGAHYDVCGEQPGADDNASGVAGLLELARLLSVEPPDLTKEIELVAYTLEEPPYFRTENMGSAVHAQSLRDAKIEVEGMISLEMIGFYSNAPGSQHYPLPVLGLFYPSRADFIAVVGNWASFGFVRRVKKLMARGTDLPVVSLSAPNALDAIGLSDQRNYWKRGMPALMVTDTSFFRNPNYHQPSDTPDTLDFARMARAVDGVFNALRVMGKE
ncbi:MAG: M28 family peptidase [Elusimicrobia bacterium]|nr:M28 family peptidase [Elusimicrobiota bacterium]